MNSKVPSVATQILFYCLIINYYPATKATQCCCYSWTSTNHLTSATTLLSTWYVCLMLLFLPFLPLDLLPVLIRARYCRLCIYFIQYMYVHDPLQSLVQGSVICSEIMQHVVIPCSMCTVRKEDSRHYVHQIIHMPFSSSFYYNCKLCGTLKHEDKRIDNCADSVAVV